MRRFWSVVVSAVLVGWLPGPVQADSPPPTFESVWDTMVESQTVRLPLYDGGVYDFTVDWGDGSAPEEVDSFDDPQAEHIYPLAGPHVVKITGTINGWSFNNGGDRELITDVMSWGPLNFGNAGGAFYGATNLRVTAADSPDLTGVWNLANTFRDAATMDGDLSTWQTGAVTDMSGMFAGATSFNQDLNGWDTGAVTTMAGMFHGASSFDWYLVDWDVSQVTDMSHMFDGASKFYDDLGAWNTGKVTTMHAMFKNAVAFTGGVAGWDTSSVTDMGDMFAGAAAFNGPLGDWDTSSVTTMAGMFNGATAFDRDLGQFTIGAVTTMADMLTGAGLSADNYSATLNGWAGGAVVPSGVRLDATASYSCAAKVARSTLIADHGWVIVDGGPLAQACASVTPSSVDFGDQTLTVGSSARPVTLKNLSTANMDVTGVAVVGPDAQRFSLSSDDCTAVTLSSGSSCTVDVTFKPDSLGSKAASLVFTTTNGPESAALVGTGVYPALIVSTSPGDFGEVEAMGSKRLTFTVAAQTPFEVTSITSDSPEIFRVVEQDCTMGIVTSSCQFVVEFRPPAWGEYRGIVTLMPGDELVPMEGHSPSNLDYSLRPEQLSFDVPIGSVVTKEVMIWNTSQHPWTVNWSFDAMTLLPLRASGPHDTAVPGGQSMSVEVKFSPMEAGVTSNIITFFLKRGSDVSPPIKVQVLAQAHAKQQTAPFPQPTVPVPQPTVPAEQQTVPGLPPTSIAISGVTVVTPANTRTTNGQPIETTITAAPLRAEALQSKAKKKYFKVIRGKRGKVSVRTYGYRLRMVVKQRAKATPGYKKYLRKAVYKNGKRVSVKVLS